MVERSLSMREVPGSIPGSSRIILFFYPIASLLHVPPLILLIKCACLPLQHSSRCRYKLNVNVRWHATTVTVRVWGMCSREL